jgi:hypothetical protein
MIGEPEIAAERLIRSAARGDDQLTTGHAGFARTGISALEDKQLADQPEIHTAQMRQLANHGRGGA